MWHRLFFPWPLRRKKFMNYPRKKGVYKWFLVMCFFCLTGITIFLYIEKRLKPTLEEIARIRAQEIATRLLNLVVKQKASGIRYQELIFIKTDNRGKVVLMQPNTGKINRLTAEITLAAQEMLLKSPVEKVLIPLGQISGKRMIAGLGPRLPVSFQPFGVVDTNITDRFQQAGINQTRHKIYMSMQCRVKIIFPLYASEAVVKTTVPLSEAIIMGEVPQVYFGGFPLLDKTTGLETGTIKQGE